MPESLQRLDALQLRAVEALTAYRGADPAARTEHLRTIAEAFVQAREHFLLAA